MNANTIQLREVLPWSPDVPRNILVCDSLETDGNFVLSTMVEHLFSSPSSLSSTNHLVGGPKVGSREKLSSRRALWLSGNASTEQQVASGLKKIGCDAGATYLRKNNHHMGNNERNQKGLTIRSLAIEISEKLLSNNENSEDSTSSFHGEAYLKSVYKDIKEWIRYRDEGESLPPTGPYWIILDDVTSLASMIGDKPVYRFVESVIHLLGCGATIETGLILRCSGDLDHMLHKLQGAEGTDHTGWVGAGGLAHKQCVHDQLCNSLVPWERALEESVDAIIDVLPLLSGFSREAHGRLIFSETPNGRGWKNNPAQNNAIKAKNSSSVDAVESIATGSWNKLIFNYSIQDSGARAIRLRAR